MFAGHAAAQLDALLQNIVAGRQRATDLVGVALVVEHQRMNVAVAGVKDVRDAQPVFLARGADTSHDLRQF